MSTSAVKRNRKASGAKQNVAPSLQNTTLAKQKYALATVRIVFLLYGPSALHKAALCKPCVRDFIGKDLIR